MNDFMDALKREWVDKSVPSDYHSHPIVPWAVEEVCYYCKYPASHKIGENDHKPSRHPLTAYVCCNHFWAACYNTKVIMKPNTYANEGTYDRT